MRIERVEAGLSFRIGDGDEGNGPWLLQHSRDMEAWENLKFFSSRDPQMEVAWDELPSRDPESGFFRAVRLAEDDPFLRRFLEQRAIWRSSRPESYVFELQQDFGPLSWFGSVTVVDLEVESFETIDEFPPGFTPDVPTIDGLFDRIASAIAQDAVSIDVTWDKLFGFPSTCYIDISELIADEESGWAVRSFTAPE